MHILSSSAYPQLEYNIYIYISLPSLPFCSTGKVLLEIAIPTKEVTSVAFGGPNLDILYVTTAAKPNLPLPAGTTYKVTGLGAKGYPGVALKI